ncbi:MAG: NAD-dependent epimerase/dehydratase family protein [Lamprobacter sp.]|uniref:NAD-dependent epimerase/dehydratase family protein n=1 Tax=Lamprobacter sp. TaxID=3100796 RepID=UPI002B25A512|nr:NAD-dependent epimerase/dehydratase family protein [Lamprobacter sp.]MEA3638319.1 NAD-dependent epimerase/dehydratase family protein [Lamprobacter sp.]
MIEEREDCWLRGRVALITGVTGGIGSVLATRLLGVGAQVRGLTRTPAQAKSLFGNLAIDLCYGDLLKPDTLTSALDGVAAVFHLASYVPPLSCVDRYNAPGHWAVTATGTQALINAMASATTERLVYLSSVKAMGDTSGAAAPADEAERCEPQTLYGRAKLEAERIVLAAGEAQGRQTTVLRIPMVYGIDDTGNIPRMVRAIARRRFPPWPNRPNRRSAIHVNDVVSALLLCLSSTQANGKTYLATDGNSYSTRWIYEEATRACGRQPPPWGVPVWLLGAAAVLGTGIEKLTRRGIGLNLETLEKLRSDAWYDAKRISTDLGFAASHDLAAEISRLVARLEDREALD